MKIRQWEPEISWKSVSGSGVFHADGQTWRR